MFNIHPGETFNSLLVCVQYHIQILTQQYFYIVFKISWAVWSQTLNTTQSTIYYWYNIFVFVVHESFTSQQMTYCNADNSSHSYNSLTSNMRVFWIQCHLLTEEWTLYSYIFIIRVIFCYIRDKRLWTSPGRELIQSTIKWWPCTVHILRVLQRKYPIFWILCSHIWSMWNHHTYWAFVLMLMFLYMKQHNCMCFVVPTLTAQFKMFVFPIIRYFVSLCFIIKSYTDMNYFILIISV